MLVSEEQMCKRSKWSAGAVHRFSWAFICMVCYFLWTWPLYHPREQDYDMPPYNSALPPLWRIPSNLHSFAQNFWVLRKPPEVSGVPLKSTSGFYWWHISAVCMSPHVWCQGLLFVPSPRNWCNVMLVQGTWPSMKFWLLALAHFSLLYWWWDGKRTHSKKK